MELASLEIRIARSENLPVLPQVVSSVLRMADDPDASPREIEKTVERDPAITAKILKVANSAFYGHSNVSNVGRAVSLLGMNVMRSLVVSIAFQQVIGNRVNAANFDKLEYWRHSLAVGVAARILGKIRIPMKAEELFVAGLMHDIGMLVLDRFLPSEFDQAIQFAKSSSIALHEVEQEVMGFDHAAVGGLLAERWGLSTLMKRGIEFHHQPSLDGDYYETTCLLAAANTLAHQCGFTNSQMLAELELDPEVSASIGLPPEQYDSIRDVMVVEVVRAQEAFHIR